MAIQSGVKLTVLVSACALALAGCAQEATETKAPEAAAAPAAPTLPVSLNAVMVSMVDHASDPIWLDAYKPPTTDDGWRELEYHAYQMAVYGKVIQLAGTGPNDAGWVADADWRKISDDMSGAGMAALKAAQTKDVGALNVAGDKLVEACEACHKKFKPDLPSMGIVHKPDFPPGYKPAD